MRINATPTFVYFFVFMKGHIFFVWGMIMLTITGSFMFIA